MNNINDYPQPAKLPPSPMILIMSLMAGISVLNAIAAVMSIWR